MDASEYHRIADAEDRHWWYRSTRRLVRALLDDAGAARTGVVSLDIGAGPGGNGAWLAEQGPLVALDIEPIALDYVRTRRPRLLPVRGSAEALPVAASSIDVALVLTVLYHVPDDGRAVREIARVLAPNGHVVLLEPAFPFLRREHDELTHGLRRYLLRDLERLAASAGLDIVRSTYAKSYLFAPMALITTAQRATGRLRSTQAPRSDLRPRRVDRLANPTFEFFARLEDSWLRRHDLPFGTSAVVIARKRASA